MRSSPKGIDNLPPMFVFESFIHNYESCYHPYEYVRKSWQLSHGRFSKIWL
jgi:hypothetical protein